MPTCGLFGSGPTLVASFPPSKQTIQSGFEDDTLGMNRRSTMAVVCADRPRVDDAYLVPRSPLREKVAHDLQPGLQIVRDAVADADDRRLRPER